MGIFFWIMPTTTLCHSFASLEDRSEERSDEEFSICPQIVDSSLSRVAGSLRMTSQPKCCCRLMPHIVQISGSFKMVYIDGAYDSKA